MKFINKLIKFIMLFIFFLWDLDELLPIILYIWQYYLIMYYNKLDYYFLEKGFIIYCLFKIIVILIISSILLLIIWK
jgi:hypothetical protein